MSCCPHGFGRCPRCDHPRPENEPSHQELMEQLVVKFEDGLLQWPGGSINLDMLRWLLARSGFVLERECAEHGRSCWDARCDVRDK